MTESIIVYRNPLEQAIWENSAGAEFIPIIAACITFIVVGVLIQKYIIEKSKYGSNIRSNANYVTFIPAFFVAFFVAKYLWL